MGTKTYCIFRDIPYIAWSLAKYNETISFSGEFVMYGNLDYSFIHKMIEDNRYLKYIHFDTVTFDGVNNNQLIVLDDDSSVGVVQNAEYTTLTNANISTSVTDENGETRQVSFNDMFKMAEKGEYKQFNIRLESNEGVWDRIIDFVERFYTAALSSISRLINTIARYIKKK